MQPSFLVDMNISPLTVERLRSDGWDVIRVSELLPATAGDDEILQLARKLNRCVITADLDFSAMLALGGHARPSVISLRISVGDPETVCERLVKALPMLEPMLIAGCIATVEDSRVRVRDLPILGNAE